MELLTTCFGNHLFMDTQCLQSAIHHWGVEIRNKYLRSVIVKVGWFYQPMLLNSFDHQAHFSDPLTVKFTSTQEVIVWTILELLVIPYKTFWNKCRKNTINLDIYSMGICSLMSIKLHLYPFMKKWSLLNHFDLYAYGTMWISLQNYNHRPHRGKKAYLILLKTTH